MANSDDQSLRIAIVKYQAAVDYALHEGNVAWSRVGVIMVAHSIIIATFAQLLIAHNLITATLAVPLALGGMIISAIWIPLTTRSFDYEKYYLLSAREIADASLELRKNRSIVEDFLERGERFSDRKAVYIDLNSTKPNRKELRMQWNSGLRASHAIAIIHLLFLLFYFSALFLSVANLVWTLVSLVCSNLA